MMFISIDVALKKNKNVYMIYNIGHNINNMNDNGKWDRDLPYQQ